MMDMQKEIYKFILRKINEELFDEFRSTRFRGFHFYKKNTVEILDSPYFLCSDKYINLLKKFFEMFLVVLKKSLSLLI